MANRAYLYTADSATAKDWKLPDDGESYDSRWTIPSAWWFLFSADDLQFVDVEFDDLTWQSLRFVADRTAAINRIQSKRGLLDAIIAGRLDARHVDYFPAVLSAWPGRYLLMNPDELFEDDPHEEAANIGSILSELHDPRLDSRALLERVKHYSAIEPKDHADVLIFGCTYGPIADRLWHEMMRSSD